MTKLQKPSSWIHSVIMSSFNIDERRWSRVTENRDTGARLSGSESQLSYSLQDHRLVVYPLYASVSSSVTWVWSRFPLRGVIMKWGWNVNIWEAFQTVLGSWQHYVCWLKIKCLPGARYCARSQSTKMSKATFVTLTIQKTGTLFLFVHPPFQN